MVNDLNIVAMKVHGSWTEVDLGGGGLRFMSSGFQDSAVRFNV